MTVLTSEFLSIFGVSVPGKDETPLSRAVESMTRTPTVEIDEAELASAFRKIISEGDRGKHESRMSFLNDFFGANYRCRQILGQPLMIGTQPDPNDVDWWK